MSILYRDDLSYIDLIYGFVRTPEYMVKITDGDTGMTDIKEIREYWANKYPRVMVTLWEDTMNNRYRGRMVHLESKVEITADTIGDLISQGEAFLRRAV